MDQHALNRGICAELDRLGLRLQDLPGGGLAGDEGWVKKWLEELRALAPGVTWREVLPDLPAHWQPGRPETWTTQYRPFGPFDYPELPAGPAVHLCWPAGSDSSALDTFVAAAAEAGWPVYGAGLIEPSRDGDKLHAHVVLERGTDEDRFGDFLMWIEARPSVELAAIARCVDETYFSGSGDEAR